MPRSGTLEARQEPKTAPQNNLGPDSSINPRRRALSSHKSSATEMPLFPWMEIHQGRAQITARQRYSVGTQRAQVVGFRPSLRWYYQTRQHGPGHLGHDTALHVVRGFKFVGRLECGANVWPAAARVRCSSVTLSFQQHGIPFCTGETGCPAGDCTWMKPRKPNH
ncbi:hypothetical protein N658DRAFT_165252 [Parathielavia hyrcaniae]|uniref:Uncharacterized protein n=1 Tax=Parathielavia hyrcaniae TaxID=113614 RepID=A0AAN6PX86_9PEZI|nr:hypothetical protein N658DRAFT_165252 [Parathielavia hyrcaniae]